MEVLSLDEAAPRTSKSRRRRDAIIQTAIAEINARSFASATMKDIAARLQLRDAALYYYFPTKRDLGYACHVHSLTRVEAVLDDTDRAGGTGLAKVEGFIAGMLDDSVRNGPQLYLGDLSYLNETQRSVVTDWMSRLKKKLERFLQDGIADGTIRSCETELVVQLLMGMLIWLAKWTPEVDGLTVERLIRAIGVVTFEGLERRNT